MEVTVEAIRPIPSIALLPIALIALGFGYRMEIVIVAFACVWPILILSRAAVRSIEPRLMEVARALRLPPAQRVWKIIIPAALPRIFVAFRLSAGIALIVAVTVEIAINPLGLGAGIMLAQQALRPDLMLAYLVWIGIIGYALNILLTVAQQPPVRPRRVERRRPMNRAVILWRVASFAVAAGFIALWQLIANLKLVSPVFLPGPDRAWAALVRGFSSGDLWSKLAGTLEHMAYGWLAASIAGIAIGAIIGSSRTMRTYVAPSLEFLRPLPVSAIIPVAIAMLGLTQAMALFVIAFGAIWPIMLATIHGFAAVEPRLYEVARSLQMSRLAVIFKDRTALRQSRHSRRHAPQPDGGADSVGGLRNPGRPRRARPLGAAVGPRVPLGRPVRRCHPAWRYRLRDVRSDVDGRTSAIGVAGGAALVVLALRALNAIGDLANCNG